MSFVHLHVHSMYSLLDGFSNLKQLVERTRELEMPAVALTDHGTMFGIIEFYQAAKKAGVKPIVGLETYMASRRMTDREAQFDKSSFHLLLLAENDTGYLNLLKIASASQIEGFYYHPRIDHEFLAEHAEGLIATTACMSGEVPRALLAGNEEKAIKLLDWYYELFGPERFFVELQRHDIDELDDLNKKLFELGKRYNARYVATNDVHYINQGDARFQDIQLAIQTGALLTENKRFRMNNDSYYLRTPDEMKSLFSEFPGSIDNTLLIAERCHVDLEPKGYHLPNFPVPDGCTAETYLRDLCEKGLQRRYGSRANDTEIRERLEYELSIIHQMGFDAYFLIVWDLCRYARGEDIWYNARGSAAGSMVAYTLDITMVEPMEHGLIFERFLNPARVNMPDIDLDFQDDKRSCVMEYCAQKYGYDKVASIITFGTLGAKAAIRDVGRVMDIPLMEVNRVTKAIPTVIQGKPVTINNALEDSAELKELYDSTPYLKELIETASHMEGVVRNAGTHAAGVVITDIPIVNYAPLHRPTSNSEDSPIKTVTQFEMSIVDAMGLLKVDFLGLSTLTVMQRACQLIKQRHNIDLNLTNIPLDDEETFEFLGKGHTAGVFQLEGNGMTRYLMQMRPRNLDNIIAMVALYRPGPLEFIPSYIKRMHGEENVSYRDIAMKPIFEETYGIPIYQEQIMRAAMDLAGYEASESDDLRKAIAKKKIEAIKKHREKFIEGCCKRSMEKSVAEAIFTDWENFARYGFNKSHAADYGVIAVETAYLKTHYTVEYMTALLSASKNDATKVAFYVADCRSMGIEVLPPDINSSGWDFTIEEMPDGKPAIRFGMGAVKNVGFGPVEIIIQAREEGKFNDLGDLARRLDLRQVGKRALESLVRVGALDSFGLRNAMLDSLDRIIAVSTSHFRAAQSGQISLFEMVEGFEEEIVLPPGAVMDSREQLEWERELMGLYVSAHPLTPYLPLLKRKVTHFSGQLGEARDRSKVTVAGMVARMRPHNTKSGKSMGFASIEDIQGNIELVIFPAAWKKYHNKIAIDQVILVEGKLDAEGGGDPKVLVDRVEEIELDETEIPDEGPSEEFIDGTWDQQDYTGDEDDGQSDSSEPDDWSAAAPQRDGIQAASAPGMENGNGHNADGDFMNANILMDEPAPYRPQTSVAGYQVGGETNTPMQDAADAQSCEPPLFEEDDDFQWCDPSAAAEGAGQVTVQERVKYILPPQAVDMMVTVRESERPKMLTIVVRSVGEKQRDVRRLRRIHGELLACPGQDRFSLLLCEKGHRYLVEFPNDTTGVCENLIFKLSELVGEENIRVEMI